MQYFIAFIVLFALLVLHESLSSHQGKGWGMVVQPLVISLMWTVVTVAAQEMGAIAWLIGGFLLLMVIKDVKGYSGIGALFFVLVVSVIMQGVVLLLSGQLA